MIKILKEPKNAIVKQYKKLLAFDGIDLDFEESALTLIANVAQKRKVGARALRGIMEEIMLEPMFEAPSETKKAVVITQKEVKEYIKKHISKELQQEILKIK